MASSVAGALMDPPECYRMTNQMFNLKESQIQLFLAHCFTLSAFTTSKTNIREAVIYEYGEKVRRIGRVFLSPFTWYLITESGPESLRYLYVSFQKDFGRVSRLRHHTIIF